MVMIKPKYILIDTVALSYGERDQNQAFSNYVIFLFCYITANIFGKFSLGRCI